MVTGVRSSCEASCAKRSCCRRRACHAIARNIAPISGTSVDSAHSWVPWLTSKAISVPVAIVTAPSTPTILSVRQTRNPYTSVRLTQMKWNGIVSHRSHVIIAARFATANAPHASSTDLRRKPVPGRSHGFDRGVRPELLAHAPHAHVDDIRARIEVVSPHLGEKPLAAHDLTRALGEIQEEAKLAMRQIDGSVVQPYLPSGEVELEPPGPQDALVRIVNADPAELRPDAGDQLIKGERLLNVIVGAEVEPTQLRRQVGARGENQDRKVALHPSQLPQHGQPVDARE